MSSAQATPAPATVPAAARAPVTAPEHVSAASDPARTDIKPPEQAAAAMPDASANPALALASDSGHSSAAHKIEVHFSNFVGPLLDPKLATGIQVSATIANSSTVTGQKGEHDVKLTFTGIAGDTTAHQVALQQTLAKHPVLANRGMIMKAEEGAVAFTFTGLNAEQMNALKGEVPAPVVNAASEQNAATPAPEAAATPAAEPTPAPNAETNVAATPASSVTKPVEDVSKGIVAPTPSTGKGI